jgi:hypothetical protein
MIVATGNINSPYRVIGVVHVVVTRTQKKTGCGSPAGLPIQEAYEAVTSGLAEAARKSGGDGIIHIGYDYRMSETKLGCNNVEPVFEVYGWGTAIKTIQ